MELEVAAIQQALRSSGLDGWLLYDFHGSNPIAGRLTGVSGGPHMTTRRWYYLIPADGPPRGLVHAIERHNLEHLPGETSAYAGREQLDAGLDRLLAGMHRVAMEYSALCAIPYVSRVDAGTAEAVRARGVEIVSSGDLVQEFEARWTPAQLATHQAAADALYRVKDRAFAAAADALQMGRSMTEYDLQQRMAGWFDDEGLISDSPPVVAVAGNAGNPHYMPTQVQCRAIVKDEVLLLDLWGKQTTEGAVFADITWVGVTSSRAPAEVEKAFRAVIGARDAAVAAVDEAARLGREIKGFEADRAARAVLEREGYGPYVLHRTGHSLGESVHGNGVHLDDYETHDDRRILAGTGFTVEPGVYFDTFGIRSEINVYRGEHDVMVTGPRQMELVTLL
jgi:Xaa-Pro aminopeptidase